MAKRCEARLSRRVSKHLFMAESGNGLPAHYQTGQKEVDSDFEPVYRHSCLGYLRWSSCLMRG